MKSSTGSWRMVFVVTSLMNFAALFVLKPMRWKWKSLSIGLSHLKLADGARLDASTSAGDDFGADPSEYDAWQQKWT